MLAVGITDGPPHCARDHQAVVLSCSHLARTWDVVGSASASLSLVGCRYTSKGVFQKNSQS